MLNLIDKHSRDILYLYFLQMIPSRLKISSLDIPNLLLSLTREEMGLDVHTVEVVGSPALHTNFSIVFFVVSV